MAESKTPLLDQLEGGKWPSFVKDMKQAAEKNPMARGSSSPAGTFLQR